MLTGHADLDTAIDAVNAGYIFRFLTKPCPAEKLAKAVGAGIEQHKLILAGRELHTLVNLKEAMEGIIMAFSTIVEARDPYTAGHQRRVAKLSVELARGMDLDENSIAAIHLSALVHDIGKIYVPADFLSKPGRLTEAEYSILWAHPQIGRDILKSVDFVWPISTIVWQHHERLDGSGYPQGLANDTISIEARILSVADVVEAMASHRPYRASLGIERALEEIEKNSGTHFDPKVVDTCLRLFREDGYELFLAGEDPLVPSWNRS
jgi:HD-GYP domain-containing protein (c-di-GMP phosphodiesterase class II)